jgi:hypothetical protein
MNKVSLAAPVAAFAVLASVLAAGVRPAPEPADAAVAIQAKLDASPGGRVELAPGVYQCATTLRPNGPGQELCGQAAGYGGTATVLKFPAGVTGIDVANDRAPGASVRNLVLEGSEPWWSVYPAECVLPKSFAGKLANQAPHGVSDADGIRLGANFARVENVVVRQFGRHGINAANDVAPDHYCDNFYIANVVLQNNRGCGLYVQGGDANAGTTVQVRCYANQLWGIWDDSFLGNTHVSPQCHSNGADNTPKGEAAAVWAAAGIVTGPYRSEKTAVQNVWISPYSEGDQSPNRLNGHNIVIGGDNGAGDAAGFEPAYAGADGSGRLSTRAVRSLPRKAGGVWAQVGDADDGRSPLSFGVGGGQDWRFLFDPPGQASPRLWFLALGNTPAQGALALADVGASVPPGSLVLPRGYYDLCGASLLSRAAAPERPKAAAGGVGDVVWNVSPAPGGFVGWVKTSSGWKGFGPIER